MNMPYILPDVTFRFVDDKYGDDNLAQESLVTGDFMIDDIVNYWESEKKGYLIVEKKGTQWEILFDRTKFRKVLQGLGCGVLIKINETDIKPYERP